MNSLTEATATCDVCEATIYRYCHSQAGALKAYAWTDVDPDGETDPRYGTRCDGLSPHVPSEDSFVSDKAVQ